MNNGLVYVGKIIEFTPIEGADFIHCATVVCGSGGKWRGIVRKADFELNALCVVYLPDSQLDTVKHASMTFMKDSGWRVKMRRFKGAPSEVVITKLGFDWTESWDGFEIGCDITDMACVTKYNKPIPAQLNGISLGDFPSFIPKTDELNYQRHEDLVDNLIGLPYYITEKCDGSSTTAYRYKGKFGICSRNLELVENPDNGYWKVAAKYGVQNKLPDGFALQWETCGNGVQGNPHGLTGLDGFAFSAYNIEEHRYLEWAEFQALTQQMAFPTAKLISAGASFSKEGLEELGQGTYSNGKQREGVVVRSQFNVSGHNPISFKVINLDYKDAS